MFSENLQEDIYMYVYRERGNRKKKGRQIGVRQRKINSVKEENSEYQKNRGQKQEEKDNDKERERDRGREREKKNTAQRTIYRVIF